MNISKILLVHMAFSGLMMGCNLDELPTTWVPEDDESPARLALGGQQVNPEQLELFAGVVVDEVGRPIVGAKVKINGVATTSAQDGSFSLYVPYTEGQYLIYAEKQAHLPVSTFHTGFGMTDMELVLKSTETFPVDPTQTIDVTDSRGTRILIPANSLVDPMGNPAPSQGVTLSLYTYDILSEQMVGDMTGINSSGQVVAMESAGAFSAEFSNSSGTLYNLAPGKTASVTMNVPPEIQFEGDIPIWSYNFDTGRWLEEGMGTIVGGIAQANVPHFSVWNFDVEKKTPACIRLEYDTYWFSSTFGGSVLARFESTGTPPRTILATLSPWPNNHALYNLPVNQFVEIYIPSTETTPIAVVYTGGPWGDVGIPPYPYSVCNGYTYLDGAQVTGNVTLEARTNHTGIQVKAFDMSNPGVVAGTTQTDASGNFTISIKPATYYFEASHASYLWSKTTANYTLTSGSTTTLLSDKLLGGDVDSNDNIDYTDIILMTSSSPPPTADIDGDNNVDFDDVNIAANNGGLSAPTSWP